MLVIEAAEPSLKTICGSTRFVKVFDPAAIIRDCGSQGNINAEIRM